MSKKKIDAKTFAQQKRRRRQWLTFVRMCRYGINNFTRNAWLTIAATAIMTITLFVVFASFTARNILQDTSNAIRDKVLMSIYVKTDTPDSDVAQIKSGLEQLPSVVSVTYISPQQARQQFAEQNSSSAGTLQALNEASNKNPGTFNIKVKNINDTSELSNFVNTNKTVKGDLDSRYPPSFAGSKKQIIEKIGRVVNFAQTLGIVASLVFIIMSTLIIFNTIRMAIFNRREEINMMKLIGAEKAFIRGPFVVEAIVYGFFAAIVATSLGITVLYAIAPALRNAQVNIQPTLDFMTLYLGIVLLAMIFIGALIGIVSSLLATRRHLKL